MDSSFEKLGEMFGNPYLCSWPNKSVGHIVQKQQAPGTQPRCHPQRHAAAPPSHASREPPGPCRDPEPTPPTHQGVPQPSIPQLREGRRPGKVTILASWDPRAWGQGEKWKGPYSSALIVVNFKTFRASPKASPGHWKDLSTKALMIDSWGFLSARDLLSSFSRASSNSKTTNSALSPFYTSEKTLQF